jgi:hypothetical protein
VPLKSTRCQKKSAHDSQYSPEKVVVSVILTASDDSIRGTSFLGSSRSPAFAATHRHRDDLSADERARLSKLHERTLSVTETWPNSIANERKARLTRLAREAEQREAEALELDAQERAFAKSKRKELLQRAAVFRFEEKPGICAVHSQLLLHEVNRERIAKFF